MVLVGFSGGAAFAGGLILDDPTRYAGAAILYGTLPFDAGVPTTPGRLAGLPVLVAHGDTDTVIPRDLLDRTWTYLHDDAGSTTTGVRDPGRPRPQRQRRRPTVALAHRRDRQGDDVMTNARPFEIGLFTFGEITADPVTGRPIDPAVRLREFIDLAMLADQAGLDVFGVGEHHRPDFAIASPPVVLAAIAQATNRSASPAPSPCCPPPTRSRCSKTSPPSTSSPTAAPRSPPAAAPTPSRSHSSATTSPTTTRLFDEKLDLLLQLNRHEHVTWTGQSPDAARTTSACTRARAATVAGVGRRRRHARPVSNAPAATACPLYLAILGQPERFAPLADLYRRTGVVAGHDARRAPGRCHQPLLRRTHLPRCP